MLFDKAVLGWLFASLVQTTDVAASSPDSPTAPSWTIHQFPNGTWVENIAVRQNGLLLLTFFQQAEVYSLDPNKRGAEPILVHKFEGVSSAFGITEFAPDRFAVEVGNVSIPGGAQRGSFSLHELDFSKPQNGGGAAPVTAPKVRLICPVPEANFLNGLTTLSSSPSLPGDAHPVLAGDIVDGRIFRIDPLTGKTATAIPAGANHLFDAGTIPVFGNVSVDGIRTLGQDLYVTNIGTGDLGKIRINPNGTIAASAEPYILARAAKDTSWDDFALDQKGNVYAVTGPGNTVLKIDPRGKEVLLAGNKNSTQIAGPTSAALSRGKDAGSILYVVTSGALAAPVNGNQVVGGQVIAVSLV